MQTKLTYLILIVLAIVLGIMFIPRQEPLEQIKSEIQLLEQERDDLLSEFEHENQLLEVQYLDKKHEINERYMPLLNQLEKQLEDKRQKALEAIGMTGSINIPNKAHNAPESDLALGDYWLSNAGWGRKPIPNVVGNTPAKRFANFVRNYAVDFDESVFVEARNSYWVKEEVLACIWRAETTLGNENKTASNIMNYGNTDNWSTRTYNDVYTNVMHAAHWLAQGTYLGQYTLLGELSWGGRKALGIAPCTQQWEYCYASSMENWRVNVSNCLTLIHWEKKDWDRYTFKKVSLANN